MTEQAVAYGAVGRRPRPGAPRSSALGALSVAGLALLALVLTWLLAEHVPAFRVRDSVLLGHFMRLNSPHVETVGNFLLHLLDPFLFFSWGVALVAFAISRERHRVALAVASIMALAPLTADLLKPLLAHPHVPIEGVHIGAASWPSGHSTAALILVLSAVLVAPARLRPAVAGLGAVYVAAVCASLLILAWHMPSDVLGGLLVATLWAALAVAVLRAAERRWPTHSRPTNPRSTQSL